jgi:hypothetical protein
MAINLTSPDLGYRVNSEMPLEIGLLCYAEKVNLLRQFSANLLDPYIVGTAIFCAFQKVSTHYYRMNGRETSVREPFAQVCSRLLTERAVYGFSFIFCLLNYIGTS